MVPEDFKCAQLVQKHDAEELGRDGLHPTRDRLWWDLAAAQLGTII